MARRGRAPREHVPGAGASLEKGTTSSRGPMEDSRAQEMLVSGQGGRPASCGLPPAGGQGGRLGVLTVDTDAAPPPSGACAPSSWDVQPWGTGGGVDTWTCQCPPCQDEAPGCDTSV